MEGEEVPKFGAQPNPLKDDINQSLNQILNANNKNSFLTDASKSKA